jgi:ParB family chromosome partitioning protein
MQEIIAANGWKEAATCYKKGQFYILLSGHRRLYAAKKLGEKQIPIYIVLAPTTPAEELDRLGSLQSGQVE